MCYGAATRTHALARAKHGEKTAKSFLPAAVRVYSLAMNPTQKQFSLNRAASKKQIPISNANGVEIIQPGVGR